MAGVYEVLCKDFFVSMSTDVIPQTAGLEQIDRQANVVMKLCLVGTQSLPSSSGL